MGEGVEIEGKGLPEKELLRPDEVAKYFSVSERTIQRWCVEERLKYCKPNGILRIFRVSVMELVEKTQNAHIETIKEVEAKIKKVFKPSLAKSRGWVKSW